MNSMGEKWMAFVDDDLRLSDLTIPGTHNTCASDCSVFARCQSSSLNEQLINGVRFLDIRCRHVKDEFKLFHGSFDLNLDFDTGCLDVCIEFLKSNPTEAIIMLVSTEHTPLNNQMNFYDVFLRYIDKCKDYWFLDEDCPSLGDSRGKIVLLRRFYSPIKPLGIDMSGWGHNKTFEIKNHQNFKFLIQDEYKLSSNEKWSQIKQLLNVTNSNLNDKNTWYLNYCSAQNWPIQPPKYIAWVVNKYLLNYLKNESISHFNSDKINNTNNTNTNKNDSESARKSSYSRSHNLGIIILDFAKRDLIESLYFLNLNCRI